MWWGDRKGRRRTRPLTDPVPATDAMIVATRDSLSSRGGSRPGIVLASSVLPDPGGPIMSMQWPPARASSSPRRASSWPRTSARSGSAAGTCRPPASPSPSRVTPPSDSKRTSSASSNRGGTRRALPRRLARRSVAASASVAAGTTSTPSARAASATPAAGTITLRTRRRARAATIGSSPGTGRSSPPSDSSPRTAHRPAAVTCSEPTMIPSAMARSNEAPPLRRSAGARLTVIRRGGYSYPLLRMAPRTLSRASCSAVSARPTMVKPGRPGATSTSTRTGRPSRPWRVAERSEASTSPTLRRATQLRLIGAFTRPVTNRSAAPRPI